MSPAQPGIRPRDRRTGHRARPRPRPRGFDGHAIGRRPDRVGSPFSIFDRWASTGAASTRGNRIDTLAVRVAIRKPAPRARLAALLLTGLSGCLLFAERPSRKSDDAGETSGTESITGDRGSGAGTSTGVRDEVNCSDYCEVGSSCGSDALSSCLDSCRLEADRESSCAGEFAELNRCIGTLLECTDYDEWFSGDPCSGQYYPCQNEEYAFYICTDYSC